MVGNVKTDFKLIAAGVVVLLAGCGGSGSDSASSTPISDGTESDLVVVPGEGLVSRETWYTIMACRSKLTSYSVSPNDPQITLIGSKVVLLNIGDTYIDAGASAFDNEDGDISGQIVVSGLDTLDTFVGGDYLIRYNVTDSDSNAALSQYRFVRVIDGDPTKLTKRFFTEVDSVWEYFEHLPVDYGLDPSKKYQLLIDNHGYSGSDRFDDGGMAALEQHNLLQLIRSDNWDDSSPFIVIVHNVVGVMLTYNKRIF